MLSLSTKGMCFPLPPFFLNEICVWSTEMEISRIVFDSRRVVPLRAESTVVELGYGQPLGAELSSVKYIFKKNFFTTLQIIVVILYCRILHAPRLTAVILHGEVSASFAFSHLIFFHDSRAFRPFSPRRMKIKKFVGLSSRRSWWFVGRGNKVREKKLRARKKRKQEQTTFRGNQYRWGFECRRVFRNESVTWGKGKRVRRTSSSAIPVSVDHPNDII